MGFLTHHFGGLSDRAILTRRGRSLVLDFTRQEEKHGAPVDVEWEGSPTFKVTVDAGYVYLEHGSSLAAVQVYYPEEPLPGFEEDAWLGFEAPSDWRIYFPERNARLAPRRERGLSVRDRFEMLRKKEAK
jgi:hypothetical protein